jgi:hypothetical protein
MKDILFFLFCLAIVGICFVPLGSLGVKVLCLVVAVLGSIGAVFLILDKMGKANEEGEDY